MTKLYFLAAIVQLVWGLTPSASKVVLEYLPVESYSAIRYTFSGLLFFLIALIKYRSFHIRLSDFPKLAGLGILAYGIDSLETLYGLRVGGVLNFALASSLNAVITAGIAILLLREKVGKSFVVGASLSIIGGLVLFWGKYDVSNFQIAAGSLVLIWGAYVFEALGFVYSKKFKERYRLLEYLACLQLSAGAFMWGLSIVTHKMPTHLFEMPAKGWMALLFVCVFSCGICYFLLYWLLNHIEGHKLAFFDCFHTVAAAAFGAMLFGEPFNSKMVIGGMILLVAVLVVTTQKPKVDPVLISEQL